MNDQSRPESGDDGSHARLSAKEHIEARRGANRTMALLLVSVSLMFLAGAFGVALLVVYGPY